MKLLVPTRPNHEAMWKWLAANPKKKKWDWPGFKTMEKLGIKTPRFNCFLCEKFFNFNLSPFRCPRCSLKSCDDISFFEQWVGAKTDEDRTRLALKIANCYKKTREKE